ncbi:MAG: WYL domain-containing protein [Inhella sp.]|jgi:predicted DNA-binding transcriptional regulator YafY|uniref:helix-turn-helix transcriptional regulator n=1 Tax=Inhella sp. TaxID=1921806 RepID=UPI0022C1ED12|nr:WYL domain-containing protein [Inhella sp.]MCE2692570.1 WYL domain-containing protein [Rubrivivax sp.]MCZ8234927.1 WYL domain-containing protein [Inhella sp.]
MGTTAADRITGLLSDGQVWTGQLLAQRSGLSLRTVRRAVAALREAGVAIDSDVGRGGGIRIGSRSALPSIRLSHREAIGMLFALAVAESLGLPMLGGGLASLRQRLSSTFAPTERTHVQRLRERILVGRPASESIRRTWHEPDAGQTQLLQEAFISSRVVQFHYRARDQRLSLRRVEPQCLLLNHPAWYLLGLDRDAAAGRTFRLDGIERLQMLDEGFVQLPLRQLAPELEGFFRPV